MQDVCYNTYVKMQQDARDRIDSAFQLLTGMEMSVSTFEHIRILMKGIHPGIDKKLEVCSKALDTLQKLQSGDVISLSAERLPEETEKQKKRKKAVLFFISSLKDLKSEIKRVDTEIASSQNSAWKLGRIIKFAKGPFGLVTLGAVIIVVAVPFFTHKTSSTKQTKPTTTPVVSKTMIQVIAYRGKDLPLTQLFIGHGADCDSPHYHAITGKVIATDGTIVVDPEGCGFGKVADIQVSTISK